MEDIKITVFTPAFNRADLLPRCYEGMKRQTNKNFIWMVIDDGSTDNTRELVNEWIEKETRFTIQYFYKINGGLHTAYNEAISHIHTELCVCIDSDDYMPDDAIEKILNKWKASGSDKYAGIVGLDYYMNGSVIGDKMPDQNSINLIDLLIGTYPIKYGDRTNVVRTELYKKYAPMRVFEGEKNFNPHYLHLQISKEYDFLVLNENLRYVEYQENGMSNGIFKQYKNSPNSFLETRKLYLTLPGINFKFKIKNYIHLISSSLYSHRVIETFRWCDNKIMFCLLFPFGFALTLFINYRCR